MYITSGLSSWGLPALFMRGATGPVTSGVVGVDGSAGSAAALRWAADEAWRRQVGLRIVSAWQEAGRGCLTCAGDPAREAAARFRDARAHDLVRPDYSHHIACVTAHGRPGEVLVSEAGQAGLLVLGAAPDNVAQVLGPTGRFCLRRGRGPVVLVPARRAIGTPR